MEENFMKILELTLYFIVSDSMLSHKTGNKQVYFFLLLVFNITLKVLDNALWQEKEVVTLCILKRKKWNSLTADDMFDYIEKPKQSTKKSPETSKWILEGYRIQGPHTRANCFICKEQLEFEMKIKRTQ